MTRAPDSTPGADGGLRATARHGDGAMPEAVRPAIAQGILGLNESELRRAIVDGRLRERRDGWIVAASIAEYVSGRVL